VTGRWISPFTGNVIQNASEIDIDHVVPLALLNSHHQRSIFKKLQGYAELSEWECLCRVLCCTKKKNHPKVVNVHSGNG
jgi:hypothetical protein